MTSAHDTAALRGPDFQTHQRVFTAHLRDPDNAPCPGDVSEPRMRVYRDLVFNNIDGVLSQAFPVLHRLCEASRWQRLVSGFLRDHRAHTPYFSKLPGEFLAYLEAHPENTTGDLPFLLELAHYEWVELALSLAEPPGKISPLASRDDPLERILTLSPLAWLLGYTYPAHRIGPAYQPVETPPQATYLLVYRDNRDEIGFLELTPVTARLLELIDANTECTGRQILEGIASELNHPNPQALMNHGRAILQDLKSRDILYQPESSPCAPHC
ncbi:MAG: putative DNA-binding domain-containing protein [Candidatus Thiodiazotropha sp.]